MSAILPQLVRLQRHDNLATLSPKLAKIRIEVCREHSDRNEKAAREALEEAAVTVAQLFDPQQKICVILDRVHRCERNEQMHLLPILAKTTTAASWPYILA